MCSVDLICTADYGQFKAKELMHQLALMLGNLPCAISQGNKIVEVASLSVRKGVVVGNAVQQHESIGKKFQEVLICGDDRTDESMFQEAPSHAYTVKIGPGETAARYRLPAPSDVRHFLALIAGQSLADVGGDTDLTSRSRSEQRRDSEKISRFFSFKEEEKHRRLSAWHSVDVKDPDEDENDAEAEDPLAGLGETEELTVEA
ncbi:TPS9 [Symbiodinium pilosum]|uniref:TPS9 protein n=1 Tax=Symbiodinium pilosum TaxID=2952 RepID=A0A812MQN0_SYMPI|nr:TPS9 [Symbiodinium pilosum]